MAGSVICFILCFIFYEIKNLLDKGGNFFTIKQYVFM